MAQRGHVALRDVDCRASKGSRRIGAPVASLSASAYHITDGLDSNFPTVNGFSPDSITLSASDKSQYVNSAGGPENARNPRRCRPTGAAQPTPWARTARAPTDRDVSGVSMPKRWRIDDRFGPESTRRWGKIDTPGGPQAEGPSSCGPTHPPDRAEGTPSGSAECSVRLRTSWHT